MARPDRSSPRVDVVGRLQLSVVDHDAPATLLDLGLGGFAFRFPTPFKPRTSLTCCFQSAPGRTICLAAQVKHCHEDTATGVSAFIIGCAFLDPEAHGPLASIHRLIDDATDVLTFETP